MTTFTNILVAWPKGMTSVANTYVAEVDGTSLWLGYLGKGGAHEQLKATFLNTRNLNEGGVVGSMAGRALGNAIGGKIMDKFRAEIDANLELYNQGGRGMLDQHKKTRTIPMSDITKVEMTTKTGMNTPPVLKGLTGPHLSCKLDGKTTILFAIPSSEHPMTTMLPLLGG